MFTGIVEELGTIERFERAPTGARLRVNAALVTSDASEGSSIAVNGVCLTALNIGADSFEADLAPETLATDKSRRPSNRRDRESGTSAPCDRATERTCGPRPCRWNRDFESLEVLGDNNYWLRIRIPQELDRYVVYKGSIAIDGISLTVASIERPNSLRHHHSAYL